MTPQTHHIKVLMLATLALLGSSGCTFSDGLAYGEVGATVEARYDKRESDSGWERLLGDVELKLVEVELRGVAAAMVDEPGAVALELTAGNLDLLDSEVSILSCAESCLLGRGHLAAIQLTATRLVVRGKVRDRLPQPRFDGELPFSASFTLDGVSLQRAIDLPLDDDHDSIIDVRLQLPLDASLFDPVPFATTPPAPDGILQLEREDDVIAGLRERLAAVDIGVIIQRSEAD